MSRIYYFEPLQKDFLQLGAHAYRLRHDKLYQHQKRYKPELFSFYYLHLRVLNKLRDFQRVFQFRFLLNKEHIRLNQEEESWRHHF